jgi:proteasome lid subunit RPN8/RPN11
MAELVRIYAGAAERLRGEARYGAGSHERAGWLFQHVLNHETTIDFATYHDEETHSTRISAKLVYPDELEALLGREQNDLILCGRWHVHPGASTRQSDTDVRGARAGFRMLEEKIGADRPAFIDVIVTTRAGAPDDWTEVDLHAYVTRRDHATGEIVINKVRIEEVD